MRVRKIIVTFCVVVAFTLIGFISLIIYRSIPRSSLEIKEKRIHSISIKSEYVPHKGGGLIHGSAEIIGHDEIKDTVQILENIKLYPGSEDEIGGDSPLAWVIFYNKRGKEFFRIDFYGKLIRVCGLLRGDYYTIDMSEYDKLRELCRKYGEIPLE